MLKVQKYEKEESEFADHSEIDGLFVLEFVFLIIRSMNLKIFEFQVWFGNIQVLKFMLIHGAIHRLKMLEMDIFLACN